MPTINIETIDFYEDYPNEFLKDGLHGGVWYEVWEDDGTFRTYLYQQFSRDGPFPKNERHGNVWWWDGNREAPTLGGNGKTTDSFKVNDRDLVIHFTLVRGQIVGLEPPMRLR